MLRRLLQLDPGDRKLLAAGLFWVLAARAALAAPGASFPDKQRALARIWAGLPRLRVRDVDAAAWAVTAAARRVPGTRCLAWSLAMRALAAQGGIRVEVRIGVATPGPGALKAHAWVEHEGRTLSWGDDVEGYTPMPSAPHV